MILMQAKTKKISTPCSAVLNRSMAELVLCTESEMMCGTVQHYRHRGQLRAAGRGAGPERGPSPEAHADSDAGGAPRGLPV